MTNSIPKQEDRVLAYMIEFGSITQLEALQDIGVMRLAIRISALKKNGYNIVGDMVEVKNRWGETCHIKRYRLEVQEDES